MISTALAIETLRVSRFVTLAASCFLLLKTSNSCCVLSPVQIHALLLSLLQVHQALREEYGEPYTEASMRLAMPPVPTSVVHDTVLLLQGDVIGCFLHMPEGGRAFEKEKSVSRMHPYCMPGSALILEMCAIVVLFLSLNSLPVACAGLSTVLLNSLRLLLMRVCLLNSG